jgi:Uma2 family endonuclease
MATVAAPVRIGPADNGRRMTLDEFLEAETEDGYRYELARGVLEVSEVPNDDHGQVIWTLLRLIAEYDRLHAGIISRCGGGSEYQLLLPGMISGRNPDVAVTLRNSPRDSRGRRPPAIVFEVVSEGSEARERDYVTKRAEYLAYGLREYWIVDPELKSVVLLTRTGDVWAEQTLGGDQQVVSMVLPGVVVRVSDLWVDVSTDDSGSDAGGE